VAVRLGEPGGGTQWEGTIRALGNTTGPLVVMVVEGAQSSHPGGALLRLSRLAVTRHVPEFAVDREQREGHRIVLRSSASFATSKKVSP
jgi:hypothetical protein